ncbi:MAG: ribosome small subunit-dependent GTPase A [Candidatus Nanopelagicales bacterium]
MGLGCDAGRGADEGRPGSGSAARPPRPCPAGRARCQRRSSPVRTQGSASTPCATTSRAGTTAILLGSSGVGKSSLVNALAGEDVQAVTDVRDFDEKGRHTTTVRRLLELPWGAFLVDTPGLRELQLWGDEDSLVGAFPDVEQLAQMCRFTDCTHESEPGCAVRDHLPEERLESWRRLRRELAYLARKTDGAAARAERKKWKSVAKAQRRLTRGY